jgi:hypothetical protein
MAIYDLTGPIEKRVRFFDGQFLQDQDFIDEQRYHLDRERRHNRLLHVAGIAEGLQVQATGAFKLVVTAGTAIDADGRPLVLADQVTVDLPPETFTNQRGQVLAAYQEVPADQQTVGGSADETRWLEHPRIVALPANAAWQGATPPVTLAQLTVDNKGTITVDASVRRYSGVRLPGATADAPGLAATASGPVELSGSLTVDGNLGVGTGVAATAPPTRLDVAGLGDKQQVSLQLRGGNTAATFASAQLTFGYNNTAQYRHAITTRHHGGQQPGNAIDFFVWRYATTAGAPDKIGDLHTMTLDGGNVGVGTPSPEAKLDVRGGKVLLDSAQQLVFRDGDVSNNLKLQLWSGYGLGINGGTLFYASNGRHSWRDNAGTNERMALSTAADGGLTVSGTGQSSFAGPLQVRRDKATQLSGSWWALELYQDEWNPPQMGNVFPAIRFRHHMHFETTLETRPGAFHMLANQARDDYADLSVRKLAARTLSIGSFGSGTPVVGTETTRALVDIQDATRTGTHPTGVRGLYVTADLGDASAGIEFRHSNATQGIGFGYNSIYATGTNATQHLNLMPRGAGGVGIGTTLPANKLTVSASANHLQLRRESTETAGDKQLFLELYQDDPQNKVPMIYPSIRFHHNNKFWHRIEGRSDGFYFKEGNIPGDGASDIHANAAVVAALQIGSVRIGEGELRILQRLAAGQLQFDLYNVVQDEYAYAADYHPFDNDRRNVWTWRPKGRVSQGRWRLDYPG